MKKADHESWPRRELFEFFSAISDPFYSVTFNLDVTDLYGYVKARGLSFYYSLVYLASKALNSVEAFRWTFLNGKPALLDERRPSFTDLREGSESFHIVTMNMESGIEDFCAAAEKKSRAQKGLIDYEQQREDLIYFSCLPWVELTSLTNERDFDRVDAIPRIAWGKYHGENGRKILGFSMELNHRFTDGVHIGMFAKKLEQLIAEL